MQVICFNAPEAVTALDAKGQAKVNPEQAVQIFDAVVKSGNYNYAMLIRDKRDNTYWIEIDVPLIRNYEEIVKEFGEQ